MAIGAPWSQLVNQAGTLALTTVVVELAIGALGVYFIVSAPRLAQEWSAFLGFGERAMRARLWSYRFSGLLLLAIGMHFLVADAG